MVKRKRGSTSEPYARPAYADVMPVFSDLVQLVIFINSVAHASQVICQLLNSKSGIAGLDGFGVVAYEDGLDGLDN